MCSPVKYPVQTYLLSGGTKLYLFIFRPSFVLQAETEDEMREWMAAFEKAKRLMLQTDFKSERTNTNISVIDNDSTTTLAAADSISNLSVKSKPTTMVDELPAIVNNTNTTDTTITTEFVEKPSIVMLSTSPENDQQSLTQSTSLTPLLVWEASRAAMNPNNTSNNITSSGSPPTSPVTQSFSAAAKSLDATLKDYSEKEQVVSAIATTTNTTTATSSSSWGIPWALVPSMFQSGSSDDISNELPPTPGGSPNVPAVTDSDGHQVIWPTRVDDSNVPKVDLIGYPATLDARNRELRHLFGGVGANEVVLSGKSLSFWK